MTAKQVENDEKATEAQVKAKVERAYVDHQIALSNIDAEAKEAATEAEFRAVEAKKAEAKAELDAQVLSIFHDTLDNVTETVVKREETKKAQKQVDKTMDAARDHLRGFARTIPMFLMAYGDRDITLANFDDYTPDDVFHEITGITEEDFRKLRDGRDVTASSGAGHGWPERSALRPRCRRRFSSSCVAVCPTPLGAANPTRSGVSDVEAGFDALAPPDRSSTVTDLHCGHDG